MSELKKACKNPHPPLILKYVYTMFTNLTLLSLIVVLGVFVAVIYFELQKINKQVLEIQKQIHYINNEVNRLKQQAKKKYYSNSKGKQIIQG